MLLSSSFQRLAHDYCKSVASFALYGKFAVALAGRYLAAVTS